MPIFMNIANDPARSCQIS